MFDACCTSSALLKFLGFFFYHSHFWRETQDWYPKLQTASYFRSLSPLPALQLPVGICLGSLGCSLCLQYPKSSLLCCPTWWIKSSTRVLAWAILTPEFVMQTAFCGQQNTCMGQLLLFPSAGICDPLPLSTGIQNPFKLGAPFASRTHPGTSNSKSSSLQSQISDSFRLGHYLFSYVFSSCFFISF